jgi:hypothetical protein
MIWTKNFELNRTRVTRCVVKKRPKWCTIQSLSKSIHDIYHREKVARRFGPYFCNVKILPIVNIRPMGKKSLNLVTLNRTSARRLAQHLFLFEHHSERSN